MKTIYDHLDDFAKTYAYSCYADVINMADILVVYAGGVKDSDETPMQSHMAGVEAVQREVLEDNGFQAFLKLTHLHNYMMQKL